MVSLLMSVAITRLTMMPLKLMAVQKPMRLRYRIWPVEMSGQHTLAFH